MLTKNIYILYPAGYSGSYLNWAIHISDNDFYNTTVKSPVNTSTSDQFGGAGTSHKHVRVPTHQSIMLHLSWVIHNRPIDKKVYIINEGTANVYRSIRTIMQSDPTGVFVIVHNNSDIEVDAYGTINCITKWPAYSDAKLQFHTDPREEDFSFYESSRAYRNFIVKHHSTFFEHMEKPNYHELKNEIQRGVNWYQTRNRLHPHEVNESTYVTDFALDNRIFDISCADIASTYFPQWLENFMKDSRVSDAYNCDYVTNYQDNYINSQSNLKWFNSITEWETTGVLDSYLTSHCGIEAHVLIRIFKNSNIHMATQIQQSHWTEFYTKIKDPSWPMISDENNFYTLPKDIQDEIIHQHGYRLNVTSAPSTDILHLDWQSLSLEEINRVYQSTKQK